MRNLLMAVWMLVLASLVVGCRYSQEEARGQDGGEKPLPQVLRVGTVYSPTGYFILRGDTLGYDYDRIKSFARSHGIALDVKVARSMPELVGMLEKKEVDVLACEIPITGEYEKRMLHCGAVNETHQVLIQSLRDSDSLVTNVTQLVGRDVWVEEGSKFEARLRNIDDGLGGGINIHTLKSGKTSSEDLINMVLSRKIDLTIIDSDVARFNKTYNDSIDLSLAVSFTQRSSWAVNNDDQWLADSINAWTESLSTKAYNKSVLQYYFEKNKGPKPDTSRQTVKREVIIPVGAISPYDSLFRHYGKLIDWDWRLLAAIAYVESGFDPDATSWAGARGLMQVMPSSARDLGVGEERLYDPATSVNVAARLLQNLELAMRGRGNRSNKVKFILASYNAGPGHILDAIALARKYDLDPNVWDCNVEMAAQWKMLPEYYNDPVCQFGYFRATETVNYVQRVLTQYDIYKKKIKR